MQRNALNGFSKFSVLHTTFFSKNQKVENKKKRPHRFFFKKKIFFSKFFKIKCDRSYFKKKILDILQQKISVYKTITLLMQRVKSYFSVFQYK